MLTLPKRAVDTTGWATKEYRPGAWKVSDANGRDLGNFPEASPEAAIARAAHFEANAPERQKGLEFRSSHFPDDPNLLVHTRANDRNLPGPTGPDTRSLSEIAEEALERARAAGADLSDPAVHERYMDESRRRLGPRIRFGEEVQSDAFQLAKKEGYRDSAKVAAMEQAEKELAVARTRQRDEFEKLKEMSDRLGNPNADNAPPELMQQLSAWKEASKITDQADTVYREAGRQTGGTIPDTVAPLEGEWPNLGIKQMLIEAANDPKIDGVGFTGANTQIKRWGTERLAWEPTGQGGFRVSFEPQVGGNAAGGDMGEEALRRGLIQNSNKTVSSLDELTELLGGSEVKAEKAWKRMNAQPEGGIYQPRAEGMTQFYNEKTGKDGGELANRAAKILKPFGGKVEQGSVSPNPVRKWPDTAQGRAMAMTEDPPEPMWFSRLTPEMKEAIKKGVPLMSVLGATSVSQLLSLMSSHQKEK